MGVCEGPEVGVPWTGKLQVQGDKDWGSSVHVYLCEDDVTSVKAVSICCRSKDSWGIAVLLISCKGGS